MNERSDINKNASHGFSSKMRNGIYVDGVSDVISFDEGGVVLTTLCGNMAIEGEGLHVTVLDITSGRVVIEGRISGAYYFDSKPTVKRGLFGGARRSD